MVHATAGANSVVSNTTRRLGASLVCSLVVALLAVVTAAPASAQSANIGLNPPEWTQVHDSPGQYPGIAITHGVEIPMSDGVVLRADVYRPAEENGSATSDKHPVIVNLTPYNKLVSAIADAALNIPGVSPVLLDLINSLNFAGTPISGANQLRDVLSGGMLDSFGVDRELIKSGYTQVVVDVRGTGTSQGVWQTLAEREQLDTIEVLDWARTQPWSNGHLGMSGVSYSAINQLQAASRSPEGLDALFAVEPMTDFIPDIVAPGGGLGVGFLTTWLTLVNSAKMIPEASDLMRGHVDPLWLQSRIENPAVMFQEIFDAIRVADPKEASPKAQELVTASSKLRADFRTDTAAITTPTFAIGGWYDIFSNAEWRQLDQLSSLGPDEKKLIMGTGYHVTPGADMGGPGEPPRIDVLQRAWFDKWLKGIDNGIDRYAPVTSHAIGGGWEQSPTIPRDNQEHRRVYLDPRSSGTAPHAVTDGSLSGEAPTTTAKWTIAPGISTLCSNDTVRDSTGLLVFLDICAADNRIAESNALTFTSPAVNEPVSINGPINVHLNAVFDKPDGFYSVVISDVAPDGTSTVVSTGSMTASLRNQLVPERSGYAPNGDLVDPYYLLDVTTREQVTPGQPVTLDVGALATDALLHPGHRLRLSIYAFNASRAITLGPVTHDTQLAPEHILLDPAAPSWISLPSDKPLI